MAKRGVHPQNDEWSGALRPGQAPKRGKRWSAASIGWGAGLLGYLVLCWFVLGPEQPALFQRFLALLFAGLALGFYLAVTQQPETPEELLVSLRRGRHADFGKQLRARQQRRQTIRIPGIGETSYRLWGGVGVVLVALLWWFTPWAPVGVVQRELEDVTVPFGQAIAAGELGMLDDHTAVCLPPSVPERARSLAPFISDSAPALQRGLRAVAEGRFAEAETLFNEAAGEGQAGRDQVSLARAQGLMFAGRFRDAIAEYSSTLELKPDSPMILCQAAMALIQAGDTAQAEPLITRAGEMAQSQSAADDSARGFHLHVLALWHLTQGSKYDEAENLFKQSRDIWEEALPDDEWLAAVSRNNQGLAYLLRSRYSAAREMLDWSRESRETPLDTAMALGNLGMLQYIRGDVPGARKRLESARAGLAESAAPVPPTHAAVNGGQLAFVNWAQWNYEVGRKYGEAALVQCSDLVGAEHPLTAPILATLATLYRDQSLYERAEPYYFRALSITRRTYGEQHPYTAAVLVRLAGLHLARANYREAEAALEHALAVFEKAFGDEHPAVAEALNLRGELELAQGRPRDARRPLERALKILEKNDFDRNTHPMVARTLGNLATLETSPRTYSRGVKLYDDAIAAVTTTLGPEHPEAARLYFGLAVLYAGQGEHARAQAAAERCLAIREKALPAFHPALAAACELLAEIAEQQPKPDANRAAELRQRAQAIRQRHAREDRLDAPG